MGLGLRAYVGLVEWTGRQVRPCKRGVLSKDASAALTRYETDRGRWAIRVKAIGSGYWRVIGSSSDLVEAARRMGSAGSRASGWQRRPNRGGVGIEASLGARRGGWRVDDGNSNRNWEQ